MLRTVIYHRLLKAKDLVLKINKAKHLDSIWPERVFRFGVRIGHATEAVWVVRRGKSEPEGCWSFPVSIVRISVNRDANGSEEFCVRDQAVRRERR